VSDRERAYAMTALAADALRRASTLCILAVAAKAPRAELVRLHAEEQSAIADLADAAAVWLDAIKEERATVNGRV
jgi:hypothetical protein